MIPLITNIIVIVSLIIIVAVLNNRKKFSTRKMDLIGFLIIFYIVITIDLFVFPLDNLREYWYAIMKPIMGVV